MSAVRITRALNAKLLKGDSTLIMSGGGISLMRGYESKTPQTGQERDQLPSVRPTQHDISNRTTRKKHSSFVLVATILVHYWRGNLWRKGQGRE